MKFEFEYQTIGGYHMRRYNFMRPLLILAVAFASRSIAMTICLVLGASEEAAGNIAFVVMLIAVILTFIKLNKSRRKS